MRAGIALTLWFLLLLTLPIIASAEPARTWGMFDHGERPCTLTLARCQGEDCYTVTFENGLISNFSTLSQVTLDLEGFTIIATFTNRTGRAVETIAVIPPPGWIAEPATLDVGDDMDGVVTLRPMLLG